ncbi:MAG: carbohydrate kinase family protein [Candidatus Moranbacteria bacterium]|nr:carbohydrate kinase family protein [Candidatus Moranbacteria bacterium]
MSKIICIGSASKDIFFPTGEGELFDTPEDITAQKKVAFEVGAKYQVEDRFEAVGGVAANCAQGLARLGLEVSVYSCVGGDQTGEWVIGELQKEKVLTELIEQKDGAQTDLSAILVFTQSGERTIFFNRDANELLKVDAKKLDGAEWVFVSALNGEWKENMRAIAAGVQEKRIKLAINPGQRNMKDDIVVVLEAIKQADVLLVNKDEAIELVMGMRQATEADLQDENFLIRALYAHGAKAIGMTDGVRGAWGYDGNVVMHVDVLMQRSVDATGSGDAFGSGFFAAWAQGLGLEQSLRWGIVNGGNVVRFYGAKEGLLRSDEIGALAQQVNVTALA